MQCPDHDQSRTHVRPASCQTTDYLIHHPHQNWIDAAVGGTTLHSDALSDMRESDDRTDVHKDSGVEVRREGGLVGELG